MDEAILSYISITFNGNEDIIKLIASKIEINSNFVIKNLENHLGLTYSGELIEFKEKLKYVVGFMQGNFEFLKEINQTDLSSRVYCSIFLRGNAQFGFDLDPSLWNILSLLNISFSIDFY